MKSFTKQKIERKKNTLHRSQLLHEESWEVTDAWIDVNIEKLTVIWKKNCTVLVFCCCCCCAWTLQSTPIDWLTSFFVDSVAAAKVVLDFEIVVSEWAGWCRCYCCWWMYRLVLLNSWCRAGHVSQPADHIRWTRSDHFPDSMLFETIDLSFRQCRCHRTYRIPIERERIFFQINFN